MCFLPPASVLHVQSWWNSIIRVQAHSEEEEDDDDDDDDDASTINNLALLPNRSDWTLNFLRYNWGGTRFESRRSRQADLIVTRYSYLSALHATSVILW
jgi:hypothetical protein